MERADTQTQNVKPEAGNLINWLRNKFETKTAKVATGTLIAMGALGLTACSNRGDAAPQPVPSHVAEVTPAPTPQATETEKPTTGEFVGGILEQTKTVEQMDAMSLQDYAKLPFADRLAYAIDKNSTYPAIDAAADPVTSNPELIPGYFWTPALNASYNNASSDERAKLTGSFVYYTTDKPTGEMSAKYTDAANLAVQNGGDGIGDDYSYQVTDHGELQHGKDRDGKDIDFMNITFKGGSNATIDTQPEQTVQAIRTEIKLLNGQTKLFYAFGYTTDGHASPVETYPY